MLRYVRTVLYKDYINKFKMPEEEVDVTLKKNSAGNLRLRESKPLSIYCETNGLSGK
jgi:hypothetical protein